MNKLFTLLFLATTYISFSQESCGTVISEADMQAFYQRDRSHLSNNLKAGVILEIPVIYHITQETDGTGGFSLLETFTLHCLLNSDFADADIHFYIYDIIFHNNSSYYHMSYNGAGYDMMNYLNNDDVCNIYIVDEAKSGSTPVCGYSYMPQNYPGPNRGGIVLDIGCSGDNSTTLTHEMGHYLNLPHTFSGWEGSDYTLSPIPTAQWENANGNNCTYTGDGFCDTPADYISDRWQCNSPKVFLDANNQNITVDEKNYMSYSMDECQLYFKPEQRAEMKNAPAAYRSYLLNLTPPSTVYLDTPVLRMPLDNFQDLSSKNIMFTWDAVDDAEYFLFELSSNINFNNSSFKELLTENSFEVNNLINDATYYWRVKAISYASVCNNFTTQSFKTSKFDISETVTDVSCFGKIDGIAKAYSNESITAYNWYKFDLISNSYVFYMNTPTNSIYNLNANKYYLELTRSGGDKSKKFFSVNEPNELVVELLIENNNSIKPTVVGGVEPYEYFWSDGSNTTTNNAPVVGENTLIVRDANFCTASNKILFESTNPIVEKYIFDEEYFNFVYYQNPSNSSVFNIDFETKPSLENYSFVDFNILSFDGKIVKSIKHDIIEGNNHVEIKLDDLSKGVYYFKFEINKKAYFKKVIL